MASLKTFADLAQAIEAEKRDEDEQARLDRIEKNRARKDQAVVGGVYRPDPVDRTAAMLLARAPWWAFAPSVKVEKKREDHSMMTKINGKWVKDDELKNEKLPAECKMKTGEFIKEAKKVARELDIDWKNIVAIDSGEALVSAVLEYLDERYPNKTAELARACLQSQEVINNHAIDLTTTAEDLNRKCSDITSNVRMNRMSIVSECAQSLKALKDVRQFFLGPDYEREQKRLAEFVDLCERLKLLKDSGFLDTVADTMIRLASC